LRFRCALGFCFRFSRRSFLCHHRLCHAFAVSDSANPLPDPPCRAGASHAAIFSFRPTRFNSDQVASTRMLSVSLNLS
jgi:hypothetical protein